jgi:hypothetical protein
MECLAPGGKLVIIHRPSNLNTLPLFGDARERLESNETPYMDIINDLQECKLDTQWETHSRFDHTDVVLENLPLVSMATLK